MRCRAVVLCLLAMLMCVPAVGRAQDFGLLESAETIDRGNFKFRVNPMFVFGKDGQDDEVGASILAGYGFTDRFDVEGGVALYDGFRFFGANAEYWALRDEALDLSVIGGLHFGRGDQAPDTHGFDLTFLGSRHVSDRLELYGALDIAFENLSDNDLDEGYSPIHFIPGFEYAISEDLDLVGEVGLGLNDEARHYISGGMAFYLR